MEQQTLQSFDDDDLNLLRQELELKLQAVREEEDNRRALDHIEILARLRDVLKSEET